MTDRRTELMDALGAVSYETLNRDHAYAANQAAKADMDALEARLMLAITAEQTDAGKPVYSNEATRKAELARRIGDYTNIVTPCQRAADGYREACTAADLATERLKTLRALLNYDTAQAHLQAETIAANCLAAQFNHADAGNDSDDLPF